VDEVEQALLEAIGRDPEDPAPYLVYADWLQARGELRGELVTLQGTSDERPGDHRISDAALDHIRAHADDYLGTLAPFVDQGEFLPLRWRCGFIGSAELTWNRRGFSKRTPLMPASQILAVLLQLESARFLTRLVIEPPNRGDVDSRFIAAVLAQHATASLRRLWIGPQDAWSANRDCTLGNLGGIWPRVAQLVELTVHGRPASLGAIDLPNLRRATIQLEAGIGSAGEPIMREVAAARWPQLELLHVWHGHSVAEVTHLLERDDLVTLGDLGILNFLHADQLCASLARSPLAPQLHRISLARGGLTDEGVRTLVANRAAFPSLGMLDVSETFVSRDGVARLGELAPQVIARDLRTGRPSIAVPVLTRVED